MRQIILIDDDPLTHALVKGAIGNDYSLVSCYSIKEADEFFSAGKSADLAIIDRKLPDGDGLSICARIRAKEQYNSLYIIFLSSKDSESDKVTGLFASADDYIPKTFSPVELKARIQARFRMDSKKINIGNLTIDLLSHRVFILRNQAPEEIDITKIEFKLLITFAQTPERLFSREILIEKAWGLTPHLSDRVVDTHISHLRKKLTGSHVNIEAVRGEGYRLVLQSRKSA